MLTKDTGELSESELRAKLRELGLTKSEIESQVAKAREQDSVCIRFQMVSIEKQ